MSEAIMDAVDSSRVQENSKYPSGHDHTERLSTPEIELIADPAARHCPWRVTWPNDQVTTYSSEADSINSILIMVRILWA